MGDERREKRKGWMAMIDKREDGWKDGGRKQRVDEIEDGLMKEREYSQKDRERKRKKEMKRKEKK